MKRMGCLAALSVLLSIGCGENSQPTSPVLENPLAQLVPYWSAILTRMESLPGQVYGLSEITGYPTEPAMTLLSAYFSTGDTRYRVAADRQFRFARSLENSDHLLVIPSHGFIGRDEMARQVYNYSIAGRLLSESTYRTWADEAAQAMIDNLERAPHRCADDSIRVLFAVTYSPSAPYDSTSDRLVDLNQNAELGMAFTLLYHDAASRFFRSSIAREISHAELYASIAPQAISPGGQLPLHETGDRVDEYDTLYGSYVTFSWVIADFYWREERIERAMNLAAHWLSRPDRMAIGTSSERWYPPPYRVVPANYDECWYRLLLYWRTAAVSGDQRRMWAERAWNQIVLRESGEVVLDPDNLPSFATPFCYFRLLGMPEDEYRGDSR